MRYRSLYIKNHLKGRILKWLVFNKRINDFVFLRLMFCSYTAFFSFNSFKMQNWLGFLNNFNFFSLKINKLNNFSRFIISGFFKIFFSLSYSANIFNISFLNFFSLIDFVSDFVSLTNQMSRIHNINFFIKNNLFFIKSLFSIFDSLSGANKNFLLIKFYKSLLKLIFILFSFLYKFFTNFFIYLSLKSFFLLKCLNCLFLDSKKKH